jgi:hypothetical protein
MKFKKNNWLNIILTSILYSDNSKKKLSLDNDLYMKINNNFKLKIVDYKEILHYLNINEKFVKYYLYYLFLPKFIEKLGMSYLILDYYKDDFYMNICQDQIYNKDYIEYNIPNNDKYRDNIKNLENNPDYLIINLWTGIYEKSSYANNIELICKFMPTLAKILNLKTYKIKTKGLSDYKNEIIFNNEKYKLDSCILENDNGIMTGITYKKNKYIYAINSENESKFIKYDWDITAKNGYKTLIYIRSSNIKNKIIVKSNDKLLLEQNSINVKLLKEELMQVKDNDKSQYKQLKVFIKYLKKEVKTKEGIKKMKEGIKKTKEGIKKTKEGIKMTKEDYINEIKKQYPYYVSLNKYKLEELKKIYDRVCNNIYINFDGLNSCYVDSLMVSLFNTKNDMIKKILLGSPIKYYEKCPKLLDYGNQIREELIKIYDTISLQKKNSDLYKCRNFRLLMQKYYTSYKKYVNKKYDVIEWTETQNDYADILSFFAIIFDIPDVLKYKLNDRIELKYFVDLFSLDELLATDKIYIRDFYPKYERTFESENKYGIIEKFTKKIEYVSAPFLFILFNRIYLEEKLETKIIPILKLKLKENQNNLYLNSIIIHQGEKNNGHYTCLYECKGIWYEYDDMNVRNITIIGSLDDIIANDNYTENITGLFYC